ATVKIVPTENLFEHLKEIYQSIAHRAYEHFEGRGQEHGHDLDDWFRAEAELLWPMPVEMVEFNDHITVRTKTPGFRCKELQIGVEQNRLIITGKTEQETEKKTTEGIYNEPRFNEIYRTLDLPAKVDPTKVTAKLKDGVLDLLLPKARI